MKILGHIIFIILFVISFFGMGPVLMADGTSEERIFTLIIVLVIYGIWFWLYRYFVRKMKNY